MATQTRQQRSPARPGRSLAPGAMPHTTARSILASVLTIALWNLSDISRSAIATRSGTGLDDEAQNFPSLLAGGSRRRPGSTSRWSISGQWIHDDGSDSRRAARCAQCRPELVTILLAPMMSCRIKRGDLGRGWRRFMNAVKELECRTSSPRYFDPGLLTVTGRGPLARPITFSRPNRRLQ